MALSWCSFFLLLSSAALLIGWTDALRASRRFRRTGTYRPTSRIDCSEKLLWYPDHVCSNPTYRTACRKYCQSNWDTRRCEDNPTFRSLCSKWKKYDKCGANIAQLQCKRTCTRCAWESRATAAPLCADTDRECPEHAQKGKCRYYFYQKQCPKSCGVCRPKAASTRKPSEVCKDIRTDCQNQHRNGNCGSYYIQKGCPRTCGLCRVKEVTTMAPTSECTDRREICEFFKKMGKCTYTSVQKDCSITCGTVDGCASACRDKYSYCTRMSKTSCETNFGATSCPMSCGKCNQSTVITKTPTAGPHSLRPESTVTHTPEPTTTTTAAKVITTTKTPTTSSPPPPKPTTTDTTRTMTSTREISTPTSTQAGTYETTEHTMASTTTILTSEARKSSNQATVTSNTPVTNKLTPSTVAATVATLKGRRTTTSTPVKSTSSKPSQPTKTPPTISTTTSTRTTNAKTTMVTTTTTPEMTTSPGFYCNTCDPTAGPCNNKPQACAEDENYCMTTMEDTADGKRKISKSCVTRQSCFTKWYQQTYDEKSCLYLLYGINKPIPEGVECNFCCVTPGCNADDVPPEDTLFQVSLNAQSFTRPQNGKVKHKNVN